MGYSVLNVDEIEPAGPAGAVLRGSGLWRVDGHEIPVRAGTVLRVDADSVRCPVAGPDGLTMVAVGARQGSYDPRGPF